MCALLFQIRALVSTAEEVGLRDPSPGWIRDNPVQYPVMQLTEPPLISRNMRRPATKLTKELAYSE